MTSDAQIDANRSNSQRSTGPRTEEGKAASSRNALTYGLFTMRDFVRPEEKDEYSRLCAGLWRELSPQTILEQTYVTAIVGASWRLRRCGLVEAGMAENFDLDPMEDVVGSRIQTSVDRARSQSFNILRRSTAELRRLQTNRAIAGEVFPEGAVPEVPGLVDYKAVISTALNAEKTKAAAERHIVEIFKEAASPIPSLGSNCKMPQSPFEKLENTGSLEDEEAA